MKTIVICETHNTTVLVGPGTLMDELECPTCLGIADGAIPTPVPDDPETAFVSRITQHHNGDCMCHTCDPDFCYYCGHYADFCKCQPEPIIPRVVAPEIEETPF